MKTTLFTFETPEGTFWIRPEPAGRVQLGIGRTKLRTYRSATAAARDVATRKTGYAAWDDTPAGGRPRNLQDWKRSAEMAAVRRVRAAGRALEE